ncbi:hypothetical protein [Lysinibacillus sp. SGAir0095]|uniref:hypothetical protein n=1 Tax=Lysinibacillus sp. SGAir0095 TaxID=2070463 RepID=UPI0010CCF95F|nr:hypothetical protein [Lysinibacillus sp. SGAir0095]QCR34027.1 hypothetical protein C1N55_18720 [Lysinibacillus sp. SGAir0095]
MNGKKVAIYFVGFIILVCILIVVAMQIFFNTYEPKTNNGEEEVSSSILEKHKIIDIDMH